MAVTALTSPEKTAVESYRAPTPHSITATSTRPSRKHRSAISVRKLKNVGGGPWWLARAFSRAQKWEANASWLTGRPLICRRSQGLTRCGEAKRPVLRPCDLSTDSVKAAVDPLPLVPAILTTGSRFNSSSRPHACTYSRMSSGVSSLVAAPLTVPAFFRNSTSTASLNPCPVNHLLVAGLVLALRELQRLGCSKSDVMKHEWRAAFQSQAHESIWFPSFSPDFIFIFDSKLFSTSFLFFF